MRQFGIGDRVVFRWFGDSWDWFLGRRWTGTVTATTEDGRLVRIQFHVGYEGVDSAETKSIWRSRWRVKLIEAAKPKVEAKPNVVALPSAGFGLRAVRGDLTGADEQVLHELTIIERHLGSAEALLDLLRDIRKSYGKDEASGG